MSLDLRILPLKNERCDFAHDMLDFSTDPELIEIIERVEKRYGRDVNRDGISSFCGYSDKCDMTAYGPIIETPYGNIMQGVPAKELKKALSEYKADHWRNKAVIAYVNELPDNLEVYLFWH